MHSWRDSPERRPGLDSRRRLVEPRRPRESLLLERRPGLEPGRSRLGAVPPRLSYRDVCDAWNTGLADGVGQEGQKAIAYRYLVGSPVLNDTFEGRGLVATLVIETAAINLFDRTVDGRMLTFDQANERGRMADRETGSIWDKRTGEALSGELTGNRLEPALFISAFWFAWSDFWPETDLYEPESG